MTVRILSGHVLNRLAELPDDSVHCVCTSPPYYGLRDYGIEPVVWGGEAGCDHEWGDDVLHAGMSGGIATGIVGSHQDDRTHHKSKSSFCLHCNAWRGSLGLEPTPALYVEHLAGVFRAVRRVLRRDGTLWINIGDSYAVGKSGRDDSGGNGRFGGPRIEPQQRKAPVGTKPKDLLGIPWMLAFALRDDGWYLRSEITWAKKTPMPESVTDRPTSATEKVFLLAKSARYFYDAEAVKEEAFADNREIFRGAGPYTDHSLNNSSTKPSEGKGHVPGNGTRNMRNWWLLGPEPFAAAHFATFPSEIPRRAILAGCPLGGTVLDPFLGAGTTGLVADQLQRDCIGIELNPAYAVMAERLVRDDCPLFAEIAAE